MLHHLASIDQVDVCLLCAKYAKTAVRCTVLILFKKTIATPDLQNAHTDWSESRTHHLASQNPSCSRMDAAVCQNPCSPKLKNWSRRHLCYEHQKIHLQAPADRTWAPSFWMTISRRIFDSIIHRPSPKSQARALWRSVGSNDCGTNLAWKWRWQSCWLQIWHRQCMARVHFGVETFTSF